MKAALNWCWLLAGSAAVIIGMGIIAKGYWLLFMLGWGAL